ncbi:MAG: hypothetical protein AB7S38_23045 [Vulcanimicrobiota bacterium]
MFYCATRRKKKGLSLGLVLVITALVVSAGFSLASLSITHLNLTQRATNAEQATNLARSAVNLGLARILEDAEHDYGVAGTDDETLEVQLPGTRPGAVGRLTFSRVQADDLGIPCSTNNLQGNTSVSGDGMVVPTAAVHLVGVGECAGVVRQVDAIVSLSPFPYALASAGPVLTHGAIVVSGLDEELRAGPLVTPEQLLPADLHSNAPGPAVSLASGGQFGGDVKAVGKVSREPGVTVLGQVQSEADELDLPSFDFSQYDPQLTGRVFTALQPSYPDNLTLTGTSRRQGGLTINEGGLDLEGAILYVDGDLTIRGGLRGKGIVCTTGAVTLEGTAEVDPESSLALLAAGDITLTGSGPHGSYLQGLVYTEGRFVADSVTLIGTLVASGDGSANVDLTDTRIFGQTDLSVEFALGGAAGPPTARPLPSFLLPVPIPSGYSSLEASGSALGSGRFQVDFTLLGSPSVNRSVTVNLGASGGLEEFQDQTRATFVELWQATGGSLSDEVADFLLKSVYRNLTLDQFRGPNSGGEPGPGPTVELIRLDPSKFLKFNDRARFALWRES